MPAEWWLVQVKHALSQLANYGVIVPFALGLYYWARLTTPARIIVLYFGFWAVEAVVNEWSVRVLHNNIYLYHITVLVETWLLGWAYYYVLREKMRRVLLLVGGVFTIVCLLDASVWAGLNQLNTYARTAQVIVMLGLILLYFEQWLEELRTRPWADFMFVVSVAQAIYYAGSFMAYLLQSSASGVANSINGLVIATSYLVTLVLMTWALWRETRSSLNGLRRSA